MSHLSTGRPGIALVGYRATGKSSVGRIVAERLVRPFADVDREVEVIAGRSIREIFADEGEPAFRQREAQALADLATRLAGGVLATGGGAVLLEPNRRLLREFGMVAWLTADAETLAQRLQASRRGVDDRPALTPAGTLDEIAEVLGARTALYQSVADVAISTRGLNVNQVAEAVLDAWSRRRSGSIAIAEGL